MKEAVKRGTPVAVATRTVAAIALVFAGSSAINLAAAQTNSNGIDLTPKSDWACEVVLCLASPNSPTEFAECVPPIEKLYKELAKGASFPSCGMGGAEGGTYARQRGNCIDVYIDSRLNNTVNWRTPGGECSAPGGGGGGGTKPNDPTAPVVQR